MNKQDAFKPANPVLTVSLPCLDTEHAFVLEAADAIFTTPDEAEQYLINFSKGII